MAINTGKVQERRRLRFNSLDEVLAEAERLAATERVRSLGNWSVGQALGHLGESFVMSLDGSKIQVAWYLRLIGPFIKGMMLKEMRPGINLPAKAEKATVPAATITPAEGLAAFRQGYERYRREPQRQPHGVFGRLTPDEWDRLHLRHAELHLSFLVPE